MSEETKTKPRAIETLISPYALAGYPAIAIETYEEPRVIAALQNPLPGETEPRPLYSIAAAGGLRDLRAPQKPALEANYGAAFAKIAREERAVLIVFDWQHVCSNAAAYRPLLQALPLAKQNGAMLIFVAPAWTLPAELKHELPVLQIPLPSATELIPALEVITEATQAELKPATSEALRRAAQGLTAAEAENAFALAALRLNGTPPFSPATVEREKMRLVRSGCMSVEAPARPESLAGLDALKDYVTQEVLASRDDDALRVKGILLVGVAGSGKSLTAKVSASILGWPLVRLDISAAKGGLVGQSEGNLRHALATADAVAPCVLWLDEIEKAIGGHASSAATDGGTTLGMLGHLLTWMQEHTSPVIVIATCNDFNKLPAELTRAGRFDEKFFLDLPTHAEKIGIARVHLARLNCNTALAETIADLTPDWTGAEIEQLVKSAARRTGRQITPETLQACAAEIIPISRTANVTELRKWATQNLRRANAPEEAEAPKTRRKVGAQAIPVTNETAAKTIKEVN